MNKKGFTLVELISVISILAIIIIIAVPAYTNVSDDIKKNNLDNKINILESTVLRYAEKYDLDLIKPEGNDCHDDSCYKCYSIDYILENDIYSPENKIGILDPTTNKKLDGYIKIKYVLNAEKNRDNFKLKSEYVKETESRTKCSIEKNILKGE